MTKRKKTDIKNFTVVIYRTALKRLPYDCSIKGKMADIDIT